MSKPSNIAGLRVCRKRDETPGGTREQRERDFQRTLRRETPSLLRAELDRIRPAAPAPRGLLDRIFQAIDVLLGRRRVFVERRQAPR